MDNQQKLILKPLEKAHDDSQRVYAITQKTVDDFNNYVQDFFGTISILKEKLSRPDCSEAERAETERTIQYIEGKIEDITQKMQAIADEMSALIEVTHGEGGA